MFKMIMCVTIVLSSCFVGYSCSRRLYQRKAVLTSFVQTLSVCSTKIRYTSRPLSEVFSDSFIDYVFSSDKPFESQWHDMLRKYERILTKNDLEVLKSFSKSCGTADAYAEQQNIGYHIERLNALICDATLQIDTKSKLYRTLGLSLGLTLAILII